MKFSKSGELVCKQPEMHQEVFNALSRWLYMLGIK